MRMAKSVALPALVPALLLAGGCAHFDYHILRQKPVVVLEQVRYETTPCHGSCPVYAVTIDADGHGSFTGLQSAAVIGTRRFAATPVQARAFLDQLRPYRPAGEETIGWLSPGHAPGEHPRCRTFATDQSGIDIRWESPTEAPAHLAFDFGCAADNPAMAAALRDAPLRLPIADLIGRH